MLPAIRRWNTRAPNAEHEPRRDSGTKVAVQRGYSGELCPECNLWMCSVEKLREAGFHIANAKAESLAGSEE